jgi:hypothetical protein
MNKNSTLVDQLANPTHPVWTIITIATLGILVIGTLGMTTSKWDTEVLVAVFTIGAPLGIEYIRRKWATPDQRAAMLEDQLATAKAELSMLKKQ